MVDQPLIILFVKAPTRGQVKTRLATTLGEDVALGLYRNFGLDILNTLEQTGPPVRICYDPPGSLKEVTGWLGSGRQYLPQEGSDVGERMENAFHQAFSRGFSRAVLIGSDIPDLPPALFTDALRSLDDHDAVIGPARDGGYYLLGFRNESFLPAVFRGIPWSTGAVFEQTMAIIDRTGRRVHVLPVWQDVDTVQDLKDLATRGRRSAFRSSHTMYFLTRIKDTCSTLEDTDATIRL
jgi:uncharacterized protein